jgi:TatD DNase family protein
MKIFETHAHYDDSDYDEDREELLEKMLGDEGVIDCIINVGASLKGCEDSILLASKHEKIYAALGVHPQEVEGLVAGNMKWIKENASMNRKVVAIGEIGLDYHFPEPSKELQKFWFRQQLKIARDLGKPVIIHSRDACADTLECLKLEHAEKMGGIIHCYSYSKEAARDYLEMGFHIGIGGVITFKNAKKIVEAVEYIPMDRLVLETDSPYLAPEPHRGSRNDSRNIEFVAAKIAEIKGVTAQEVIDVTNANAKRLFKIK